MSGETPPISPSAQDTIAKMAQAQADSAAITGASIVHQSAMQANNAQIEAKKSEATQSNQAASAGAQAARV